MSSYKRMFIFTETYQGSDISQIHIKGPVGAKADELENHEELSRFQRQIQDLNLKILWGGESAGGRRFDNAKNVWRSFDQEKEFSLSPCGCPSIKETARST